MEDSQNHVPEPTNPTGGSKLLPFLVIAFLIVLAVVGMKKFTPDDRSDTPKETTQVTPSVSTSPSTVPSTTPSEKPITMSEIAMHATKDNCWFAVDGKVYDVTKYGASGMHKGGDALFEGCGKDATILFNTRPMGSGTPHSDKARSYLPNFQIGTLE